MFRKMCFIVTLVWSVKGDLEVEVNYSELAGEAETNKHNILNFLQQSRVQTQYKALYDSLLKKLDAPQSRRGEKPVMPGSTRRIVAGRNTSITAVPWQVSLRERTYPICGSSVITDIWLITAAHCLLKYCYKTSHRFKIASHSAYWILSTPVSTDPQEGVNLLGRGTHFMTCPGARASDLSVRLGSSWKTHGGEMYDVKNTFVHPRYVSKTKNHDVGLIELYSQLRFSARVLPIKLVEKQTKLKAESLAIVSGWGKLKEGGPSATYLQSTTIRTIAMKLCKRSGLDRKAIDPSTMFCAGSFTQPSPDACQGDSGGPIVNDGVLIGVVSWGLGCARGNFPGVYTRLANPVVWDWVQMHISRKADATNHIA